MFACEGTTPTGTSGSPKPRKSPVVSPSPKASADGTDATPTPDATPTGSATATPKPNGTATPTPKATGTATPTPKPSGTATPTPKPSGTPSATPTPSGTALPTANLKSFTLAGDDIQALTDGNAIQAEFDTPSGLAADASGNLYVADTGNCCIRKIVLGNPLAVTTYAGDKTNGSNGSTDDPDPFKARFNYPKGVAVDATGNVYVADTGNNCIRMIAAGTHAVTTIAGSTAGLKNDAGTAAQFSSPSGLAVDGTKLYVADTGNAQIRMVDLADNTHPVSTYAGSTLGIKNDADGSKAQFNGPFALAVGPDGKLYVLETLNHRIRVVDPSGTKAVTTFAGPADSVNPGAEGDTDATPVADARFNVQTGGGLTFGPDGTLYVVDGGNARIKKITAGQVSRVAGDGTITVPSSRHGDYGDDTNGVAALAAKYDRPIGLALVNGALYIADSGNSRIRTLK
jgi:sugar lactone lactonase YvrE